MAEKRVWHYSARRPIMEGARDAIPRTIRACTNRPKDRAEAATLDRARRSNNNGASK
ncbi:unnamed protein product, partial [Ilex paraguariensis]